jgi:predicted DNA-binding protein (UPF0251 family)
MEWTRSLTLTQALHDCTRCAGLGLVDGRKSKVPCNCVLRGVFRQCLNQFRDASGPNRRLGSVDLDRNRGRANHFTFGRKSEEFLADFILIARRVLKPEEYDLLRFHFLLGADYKMCCKRLNLDRGTFFHSLYRVEQKLGRAFVETRPYPLFPLGEYFTRRDPLPADSEPAVGPGRRLTRAVPLKPRQDELVTSVKCG